MQPIRLARRPGEGPDADSRRRSAPPLADPATSPLAHPIDWRELSLSIRFRRAKGWCEGCGRPHGRTVIHLGDGRWWGDERQSWRCGEGKVVRRRPQPVEHGPPGRSTRVVLATAHLDHDPFNDVPQNLAALRQRCHILHDKAERLRQRRLTYLARRALGDLFTGPYRRA